MRLAVSFTALSLALAAIVAGQSQTASPPQPSPQTPTFKSRIDLARLDVSVIENKTGKPVTDLAERDFTVIENGKPQVIATFARELLTPEPPEGAVGAVVRGTDAVAPMKRRIFVFIPSLSRYGTDGPVKPMEGASRFIREQLLPQDLVAVMAFNRATDLTTNHEQVAQVVERLRLRGDMLLEEWRGYFWNKVFMNLDIPPHVQKLIDETFQVPGAEGPGARSTPSMLLNTEAFHQLDDGTATSRDLAQPAYAGLRRPWNRWVTGSDLMKIYAAIEYIRNLEGDKHVVLITPAGLISNARIMNLPPSLFLHHKDDEALLIARANDARVALNIIHTFGTQQVAPQGQSSFGGLGAMSSGNLSAATGGLFTSVRTADQALDRIDQSTRTGYILGYTPSNPTLDGRYRNVDVKVNRSDVTVVFRRGYTARADLPPVDIKGIVTNIRLNEVALTDLEANDIKIEATVAPVPASGKATQVRVEIKIDASRLTLTQKGGKREGLINLWIFCGNAKQEVVGTLKQDMTLSLDDVFYQRAMAGGIPYTATVPITGAATFVKVMVYDFGADLLGSVVVKLR